VSESGGEGKAGGFIHFLGAGPGDPELLTVKGRKLLEDADTVIYAGSLVNRALLGMCPGAELIDSAPLDLERMVSLMLERYGQGRKVVRLHSGDPSLYGAIGEQIARLREAGARLEVVPGVSSLSAAAAAIESELTVPGVSQTVIITRAEGRTPVPEREGIDSLAAHGATMAVFLSAGMAEKLSAALLRHYSPDTPVAVVQRASWPAQKVLRTSVGSMAAEMDAAGIDRTAIILVGEALGRQGEESLLYDEGFSHGYRRAAGGKRSGVDKAEDKA